MGTNTDPYQPAERKHQLTRGILEVMLETRHPVTITTKSALVVRDLDILSELAKHGLVSVALSITSMDHRLSRKMEPRASTPEKRLEALRLLSEAGVPTVVMAAPMIPAINDMETRAHPRRCRGAGRARGRHGAAAAARRGARHFPRVAAALLSRPGEARADPGARYARRARTTIRTCHERFEGEGAYAVLLQQRLQKAKERFGLDKKLPALRTDLFVPPESTTGR